MTKESGDGRGPPGERGGAPKLVSVRAEEMGGPENMLVLLKLKGGLIIPLAGGFIRFSFWRLLQNQTLTTSFSIERLSASIEISSEVGLGFWMKARSRATRTLVSIEVRFFRRRPTASGDERELLTVVGSEIVLSASVSHF